MHSNERLLRHRLVKLVMKSLIEFAHRAAV